MRQRDVQLLVLIVILTAAAAWVVWPENPGLHIHWGPINVDRDINVHLGLDLQGGMQVLLEADVAPDFEVTRDAMNAAKGIVENRVNGLGVTEPLVQVAGERRILVELPGIGRKTANVVLGSAFGIPGIVVDTHVKRLSQRIGLTKEKDPVKIEFDLMPLIPKKHWIDFSPRYSMQDILKQVMAFELEKLEVNNPK